MPTPTQFNKRLVYFIFLSVLVLGVQTIRIQRPFLGHYASYQATVMASISRNMIQENFSDLLLPKTDLIISGKKSLHLNQYPFPSLIAALGVKLFGGTLEFWGRFQAIICNLISALFLGLIALRLFNEATAWLSVATFLLSPYTMIYGQAFMSESMALTFLLLAWFLLVRVEPKKLNLFNLICAGISLSISITGRFHLILFYPLFALFLFLTQKEQRILKIVVFSLLSFAMPIGWYLHTYFASLNQANVHTNLFFQATGQNAGADLLLKIKYWKKVFDIISQMVLTPFLFPFFLLGFILGDRRKTGFWIAFGGIAFGLLTILLASEKIMKHDFYLYGTFPFMALLTAHALDLISQKFPVLRTYRMGIFVTFLYFGVSSRFFLNPIFTVPSESKNFLLAAKDVQLKTQPDNRIIVFGNDPATTLYYSDRPGWLLQPNLIGTPLFSYQKHPLRGHRGLAEAQELENAMKDPVSWFEYLKSQGASYLVVPVKTELDSVPQLLSYLKARSMRVSNESEVFSLFDIRTNR